MKIIALGHRQQTGKDTLAGFIATNVRCVSSKKNVQVAGFADELKDVCYRLYAWAGMMRKEHYEIHPEDRSKVLKNGKTVREIWIDVGNHMRKYDENVWVKALLTRPGVDVLIIKDLRFMNEVKAVKAHEGVVIKVIRLGQPEIDDDADKVLKDFVGWDLVVENNTTRAALNEHAKIITNLYGV